MTPEQLDEIERLLLPGIPCGGQEGRYASALAKTVKALREARAALEWQAAMTKALSESQERLAQEVKEARAEVERLKDALHCPHNDLGEHYCNQCQEFVRP